jgi:hypothetical protein
LGSVLNRSGFLPATEPGQRYSSEEIGAWCDCANQTMSNIEAGAMRKLRLALKKANLDKVELETE